MKGTNISKNKETIEFITQTIIFVFGILADIIILIGLLAGSYSIIFTAGVQLKKCNIAILIAICLNCLCFLCIIFYEHIPLNDEFFASAAMKLVLYSSAIAVVASACFSIAQQII